MFRDIALPSGVLELVGARRYLSNMTSAAAVLSAALELSEDDRAALAEQLLRSLDEEPGLTQDEWERAWGEELTRRVAAINAGKAELIPSDVVFAQVERLLKQRRGG